MPVTRAQCPSVLAPHDHLHISHDRLPRRAHDHSTTPVMNPGTASPTRATAPARPGQPQHHQAHVSRLLEKLGFNNRVRIALLAHDAGEAWSTADLPVAGCFEAAAASRPIRPRRRAPARPPNPAGPVAWQDAGPAVSALLTRCELAVGCQRRAGSARRVLPSV
jgi:hypothetical protein